MRKDDAVWPAYVVLGPGCPVTTRAVLQRYIGLYGWPDGVRGATQEEIAAYLASAEGEHGCAS